MGKLRFFTYDLYVKNQLHTKQKITSLPVLPGYFRHIRAMKKWWFIAFVPFVLASCGSEKENECTQAGVGRDIPLTLSFHSLEAQLPAIKTKKELVDFFSAHPVVRDQFFYRKEYPDDSVFIKEMFKRFTHPAIDTLLFETQRVFGTGEALQAAFTNAFKNIKYYYPDFKPPVVVTLLSGLETDIVLTDSVVMISLDYFLGNESRFKPNMYEYMQKRYHKDFVVPSVVLLMGISDTFNATNLEDRTALAEMISYGKAYTFAKHILPCTADSTLIGYTQRELDGAYFNEEKIWTRMVDDQVLFGTSHMIKQKYIAERPKTVEISAQCPGRIGMWVGWRIAQEYLKETNGSLTTLMAEPDAQKIFKASKYRPKK